MPDLHALHRELMNLVNDPRTPMGLRTDAELTLNTLEQILPAQASGPATDPLAAIKDRQQAPAGTWMADVGHAQGAAAPPAPSAPGEAQPAQGLLPVAPPLKRSDMLPLSGWVTDCGVTLERLLRAVLALEAPLAELVTVMSGVQEANELGKALHGKLRALTAAYLAVRGQVGANG